MTVRFKVHLATRAKSEGNFAQVAQTEGVSYDTVARAHRARAELIRAALPRPSPRVLAIDEAAFKKGHDYNTIVSDVIGRYVLETLPGRDGDWLAVFLGGLDVDAHGLFDDVIGKARAGARCLTGVGEGASTRAAPEALKLPQGTVQAHRRS